MEVLRWMGVLERFEVIVILIVKYFVVCWYVLFVKINLGSEMKYYIFLLKIEGFYLKRIIIINCFIYGFDKCLINEWFFIGMYKGDYVMYFNWR